MGSWVDGKYIGCGMDPANLHTALAARENRLFFPEMQ